DRAGETLDKGITQLSGAIHEVRRISRDLRPGALDDLGLGPALQALTAAHVIPLNMVGGPVTITTGRNLRDHGWPDGVETLAIMLDGDCAFQLLDPTGITIWWGGFLGLPNQVLRHGPLAEVSEDIIQTRVAARAKHGWIMDTYLLRRS
ncbi:MAG: hypothetical protein AAFY39_09590, partial [Pseudomonadota bacterium]